MVKETSETERRNDAWLTERIQLLWENHFADVPKGFPIVTRFGSRARYRFGSIAARNGKSLILINQLFAAPNVPTYVVDATLAHELAHYAHGFGSGLPRKYAHAHRGGVVDTELEKRGLGELSAKAERWRKAHWEEFHFTQCDDLSEQREQKQNLLDARWDSWLHRPQSRPETELCERLRTLLPKFGLKPADCDFMVEWLRASPRQAGLSYWFASEKILRVHGLLADRRIPDSVLDFQIAYWIARQKVGAAWPKVSAELSRAGLQTLMEEERNWRSHSWTQFFNRNHPLKAGANSVHPGGTP